MLAKVPSNRRVTNRSRVPASSPIENGKRELTGHEGSPTSMPIIEQFQQIAAMLVGQGGQAPIEDHKVRLGETPEQAAIAAIAFGDCEFSEEPWESQVQGGEPQPTGHLRQRTGQKPSSYSRVELPSFSGETST